MEVQSSLELRPLLWCLCVSIFFVSKQSHLISNLASLGILLELFWPVNNEPPYGRLIKPGGTEFYKPMNWQHSTMYFFFLLYGSCRLMNARFMLLKGKRK